MKKIILILMIVSTTVFAKEAKKINLDCSGEIRYGGLLSDAVFLPFDILLTEKLATKLVEVRYNNRYIDAEITCDYSFNPETFYSLRHEAEMIITAKFAKSNKVLQEKTICKASVNDGGNQTLKKSCAVKTAKIIRRLLDKNL